MPAEKSPCSPAVRAEPARVLVVEDDADHRRVLCEILQEEGYVVVDAGDGAEALGILLHGPRPDLILLDLILPVMDGWKFVAELREQPALAHIPVLAMTGAGQHVLLSAPVSSGYLEKPLDRASLLEMIEAVLERGQRKNSGTFPAGG